MFHVRIIKKLSNMNKNIFSEGKLNKTFCKGFIEKNYCKLKKTCKFTSQSVIYVIYLF